MDNGKEETYTAHSSSFERKTGYLYKKRRKHIRIAESTARQRQLVGGRKEKEERARRMHENDQDASSEGSIAAKSKKETKKLEYFLEETFQLQRYIVATGQKLMEIQSKIASSFVGVQDDAFATSFDMKKFADCLRTLFREVQRGLEVRISRIIGDLEGPLAWDGMIHPRN